MIGSILYLAIVILMIASLWVIFTKAGKPGWACLIPIYNILVLLQIVKKPWWWLLLMLIPIVNFVIIIIVLYLLAKVFGKGAGFFVGLLLLPFIFMPLLAFGDAKYSG